MRSFDLKNKNLVAGILQDEVFLEYIGVPTGNNRVHQKPAYCSCCFAYLHLNCQSLSIYVQIEYRTQRDTFGQRSLQFSCRIINQFLNGLRRIFLNNSSAGSKNSLTHSNSKSNSLCGYRTSRCGGEWNSYRPKPTTLVVLKATYGPHNSFRDVSPLGLTNALIGPRVSESFQLGRGPSNSNHNQKSLVQDSSEGKGNGTHSVY